MKFLVTDTPGYRGEEAPEVVELTTLEELLSYISSQGDFSAILHQPEGDESMWTMEFYTGYRE